MKKIFPFLAALISMFSYANPTYAQYISTTVGNGVASSAGDGLPALFASFNNPAGAYYDVSGNIYVVEYNGNKIRKINTSGTVSTFCR